MKALSGTIIALLLLASADASALTVEDAVAIAMENNPRIKEQQHRLKAQSYRLQTKKRALLPDLDFSYNYKNTSPDTGAIEKLSTVEIEAGLNLFNGFMDKNSIDEAKRLLDARAYEVSAVKADVVYEVRSAYIESLRAGKNMEVALEAVGLLERQKKDSALLYREGFIAKNDFLRVEVELASARQDALIKESAIKNAIHRLEKLLARPIHGDRNGENETLKPLPDPAGEGPTFDAHIEDMLKNRSELGYLRALKNSQQYASNKEKGSALPAIDLSLTHSRFGDRATPSGRALDSDNETRAMITATWALAGHLKTGGDASAKEYEMRATEAKMADMKSELTLQLKDTIEDHRLARGRMKVAKTAVEQAEENYRITKNQFRQQMATGTDLLDARVLLSRAKNEFNNALYDLHSAIAKLDRVVERPMAH